MQRLYIACFTILVFFVSPFALAQTVTEGTINLQKIAASISTDLEDYAKKRDVLVGNIKSVQKGIEKLKKEYDAANSESEKIKIKARTLKEISQMLDFYSQFYTLNTKKVKSILPRLSDMRRAANGGVLGKTTRQLEDPVFKKNMKTLYSNISALTLKFGDMKTQNEVASLLRENELLYSQKSKGIEAFDDIARNIDKVENYLRGMYARTVLRANILNRKKEQTQLAIQLMQYALALKPIQQKMQELDPSGVMQVPDIDYSEFVDPVINAGHSGNDGDSISVYDPDASTTLKSFKKGPNFLKER